MNTLLITGASGFIGSSCQDYLAHQYHILAPTSSELDVRNARAVQRYFAHHDIDYIIHCATVGGVRGVVDSPSTLDENLAMVENLLTYKKSSTYMITFGSGAMYGRHRSLHKVTEEEIGYILPHDLYGLSKVRIAQRIAERDDVLCFIIFACYGYGEKASRFPSYALLQNIQKQPITIERNVVFDYLFVEDMQRLIAQSLKTPPHISLINMTPTISISLPALAEIANNVGEWTSEICLNNPIVQNEYTGDNTRLLTCFPSFTFTDYTIGMTKLYHHLLTTMK